MAFAGKEGAIYKAPNAHKTKIEKRYGIFEQHLRSGQLRVAMAYFYRKSFLLMFIVIYHLNYVRVILDKMEAKRKGWYYRPAQQLVSELAKRTLLIRAIAMRRLTQKRSITAHGNGAWCCARYAFGAVGAPQEWRQQRRERPMRDAFKTAQPVWS